MGKIADVPLYIREERAKGSDDQEINGKLVEAGWQIDIINKAMNETKEQKPVQPKVSGPQDTIFGVPKKPLLIGGAVFLVLVLVAIFI